VLESVLSYQVAIDVDDILSDFHAYVDNVLVSSTTLNDHLCRIRLLFENISVSGMTLKFSKCKFLREKVKFLGHIIIPSGMSKLQAVHDFPVPHNKKKSTVFYWVL